MIQRARNAHAKGYTQNAKVQLICASLSLGFSAFWRAEAKKQGGD
jgi:hypothetical protein